MSFHRHILRKICNKAVAKIIYHHSLTASAYLQCLLLHLIGFLAGHCAFRKINIVKYKSAESIGEDMNKSMELNFSPILYDSRPIVV